MHGTSTLGADELFDGWPSCEGYFCEAHLRWPDLEHEDGADLADTLCAPNLCHACARKLEVAYREQDGDWRQHWPTSQPPLSLDEELTLIGNAGS